MHFDGNQIIQLVADSAGQIREQDVYRLFDQTDKAYHPELKQWLSIERPDLSVEINGVLEEIAAEAMAGQ